MTFCLCKTGSLDSRYLGEMPNDDSVIEEKKWAIMCVCSKLLTIRKDVSKAHTYLFCDNLKKIFCVDFTKKLLNSGYSRKYKTLNPMLSCISQHHLPSILNQSGVTLGHYYKTQS